MRAAFCIFARMANVEEGYCIIILGMMLLLVGYSTVREKKKGILSG